MILELKDTDEVKYLITCIEKEVRPYIDKVLTEILSTSYWIIWLRK